MLVFPKVLKTIASNNLILSRFAVDTYDKHLTKVLGTLQLHNPIKVQLYQTWSKLTPLIQHFHQQQMPKIIYIKIFIVCQNILWHRSPRFPESYYAHYNMQTENKTNNNKRKDKILRLEKICHRCRSNV